MSINFGILEPYMNDPDVTEILVKNYSMIALWHIWKGRVEIEESFASEADLMQVIESISQETGWQLNDLQPIIDRRLSDGTRVHIIMPPIAHQAVMKITRPHQETMTMENMIAGKNISAAAARLLSECARAYINVMVFGGHRSGKTTLINVLANAIPEQAHIIAIQNSPDLHIKKPKVITLETRPANPAGKGAVSMSQLLNSALILDADRMVFNEIEPDVVLPLLDALQIGRFALFSMHAESPHDALTRLEIAATTSNPSMPLLAVRQKMAKGLKIIARLDLMNDGFQRVTGVYEVTGLRGDEVALEPIFEYEIEGEDENGKYIGSLKPTGYIPQSVAIINQRGGNIPDSDFHVE